MKISFVIPAHNEENYIGRCLDSVFREIGGRKDCEVIVVDNNSADRTAETAARYPGARVIRETRRGANRARETGFEASSGEFVAFIDADTDMPRGWLATAEGAFARDPKLACISGPFLYYDLPRPVLALVRLFYYIAYGIYWANKVFFRRSNVVQGGNYMLRRAALEKIGGQNVNISFYGDDTDLAIRLSKVGNVIFTFKLPIRASGRRLAKEGAFTMGARYGINNFWIVLFGRPFTKTARVIRLESSGEPVYEPENKFREAALIALASAIFIGIPLALAYLAYWLAVTH